MPAHNGPSYRRDPADVPAVTGPSQRGGASRQRAAAAAGQFVTAADEQHRCCAVIDGERCPQATAFRIAARDGALDDYAYTCGDHAALAVTPGHTATRV